MAVTYEQATAVYGLAGPGIFVHDNFEHVSDTNADGTPQRWRRNGVTKRWATRPGHFRIPVKRGLREYGYITHENAHEFNVAR